MISIPLQLRPAQSRLPAAAFLIAGNDPGVWLSILAAAATDWPLEKARLLFFPTSRRDLAPAGLFVIPPTMAALHIPSRAIAYAQSGPMLYHPVDSALYPPLTSEELAALFTSDINILHPGVGLVGFSKQDVYSAAQLLHIPPRRMARWDQAVPGVAPAKPLTAIQVEMPPAIELLERGREDIATEAPQNLPPVPGEPSPPGALGELAASFSQWLTRVVKRVADTGKKATGKQSPAPPPDLDNERTRELKRLLHLLQQAPDDGLRHAIPLAMNVAPRGRANPGSKLGPHDVNFNLNALRRGGPVDPWDIPGDLQAKLRTSYRELANRELHLGRYRRAAYILAELLGDLAGAASALVQGHLYREAAILYKEQLHQNRLAAECLEKGGLLVEAIEVYVGLGELEKVGDLYLRLERPEDANVAYRQRVQNLLGAQDRLAAAAILENKLHLPDEALLALDAGWPSSSAAMGCLEESFAVRARLARHADAESRIAMLCDSAAALPHCDQVAGLLAKLARKYPDVPLRLAAADAARTIAGLALPTVSLTQKHAFIKAVSELDPDDALLKRDGRRFLERTAALPQKSAPSARRLAPPVLSLRFALPENFRWCDAIAAEGHFFACGFNGTDAILVESNWQGGFSPFALSDFFSTAPRNPQFLLAAIPRTNQETKIVLHEVTTNTSPQMPVKDSARVRILAAPSAQPESPIVGLYGDDAGTLWAVNSGLDEVASVWDMSVAWGGMLRSSHDFTAWLGDTNAILGFGPQPHPRLPLIARRDHLFFAVGNRLVHVSNLRSARHIDFSAPILHLAASESLSRIRVAAVAPEHCLVVSADGREMRFGEGMDSPLIAFTRGGTLVARDDSQLRLYQTDSDGIVHLATFPMTSRRPIAILPTPALHEFATLDAVGNVNIFRLSL